MNAILGFTSLLEGKTEMLSEYKKWL